MYRPLTVVALALALLLPEAEAQTRNLIKPSYLRDAPAEADECDPGELSAQDMEAMQSQAAKLMAAHGSIGTRAANAEVDSEALTARQQELAAAAERGEAGNHSATYERLRDGDAFDPEIEGQTAVLQGNCVGLRPAAAPSRR